MLLRCRHGSFCRADTLSCPAAGVPAGAPAVRRVLPGRGPGRRRAGGAHGPAVHRAVRRAATRVHPARRARVPLRARRHLAARGALIALCRDSTCVRSACSTSCLLTHRWPAMHTHVRLSKLNSVNATSCVAGAGGAAGAARRCGGAAAPGAAAHAGRRATASHLPRAGLHQGAHTRPKNSMSYWFQPESGDGRCCCTRWVMLSNAPPPAGRLLVFYG